MVGPEQLAGGTMSPARVAIGVCTARRPEMLCCLAALASQVVPDGVDLTLVIADNEPEPNNRQAVEEFAATCPFAVEYVHEPRRGISRARNALLTACQGRFDWVAMADDDCKGPRQRGTGGGMPGCSADARGPLGSRN
jgi:succinoglycan biosynthesis protein ExoM